MFAYHSIDDHISMYTHNKLITRKLGANYMEGYLFLDS